MDECLLSEIARAHQLKSPLSICLLDIDFFKLYNDSQGHQAGDECLKTVAQALIASLTRSDDNVSRYGGEEFLVILPDSNRAAALTVAERLREKINGLKLPHSSSPLGFLSISIGVATLDCESAFAENLPQHMIASTLINKADNALYAAKKQGRNRVIAAGQKTIDA